MRELVIDTSAIVAILQNEPEAKAFAQALEDADVRLISTVALLEAGILTRARKGERGVQELDALLAAAELTSVSFDQEQCDIARDAYALFGKGRHPAGLNFGDCAVYALAASQALPLLFKGNDFSKTDLTSVI